MNLMEERSYLERSDFIIKRYTVGGAQKVVMRYLAMCCISASGSNLPWKSYTKMAEPHSHCPNSLPQLAFAQPVSARVKCRPSSMQLSQKRAVTMCPSV